MHTEATVVVVIVAFRSDNVFDKYQGASTIIDKTLEWKFSRISVSEMVTTTNYQFKSNG
jgi:hypothetical protein